MCGSEFRIAFDGHLDGVGQCFGEVVLGFLVGGHLLFAELRGVHLSLLHTGAGVGDLRQYALLIVGGTLHGVHQLRDEVHATFVDVLHLAPGFGDILFLRDEFVVHSDAPQHDNGQDTDNGDDSDG